MSKSRSLYIGVLLALFVNLGGHLRGAHGAAVILCQGMVRSEFAVIDRAVDRDHLVLLMEPDEREWIVPRARLPTGWSEGAWLRIAWDEADGGRGGGLDGEFDAKFDEGCGGWPTFVLDLQTTDEVRATIAAKMELLRMRSERSAEGAWERP